MTVEEMDNMFDVLYNNITSNQAPGLNAYEKSVFLTKAQDEILKNYFNPKSKGNNTQDGFDANQKRQIDFSMLTVVSGYKDEDEDLGDALFDRHDNTQSIELPDDVMMIINETAVVSRNTNEVILQVVPIKYDEYSRLMSKPYKRPLKYQAWRLIVNETANSADIIIGPSDELKEYYIRYIRRPKPIILSPLDGLSIEGYLGKYTTTEDGTTVVNYKKVTDTTDTNEVTDGIECELDPILHHEILQRAVELAKVAWTATGNDNIQAVLQAGQRSE